jgi:hypothetical protein
VSDEKVLVLGQLGNLLFCESGIVASPVLNLLKMAAMGFTTEEWELLLLKKSLLRGRLSFFKPKKGKTWDIKMAEKVSVIHNYNCFIDNKCWGSFKSVFIEHSKNFAYFHLKKDRHLRFSRCPCTECTDYVFFGCHCFFEEYNKLSDVFLCS